MRRAHSLLFAMSLTGCLADTNPVTIAPPAPAPPVVDISSCSADGDCVAVEAAGCCPNGRKAAVNAGRVALYQQANACREKNVMCPMIRFADNRIAQCDFRRHQCEMVEPNQVHCGGFIVPNHQCPAGYRCKFAGVPDVGGTCVRACVETVMCEMGRRFDPETCSCVPSAIEVPPPPAATPQ